MRTRQRFVEANREVSLSERPRPSANANSDSERVPDIQRATEILNDVPKLIAHATEQERRALLVEVFDDIYLTPHQAMAVRPAMAYTDILKALDQSSAFNQMFVWWAGWAPMVRDHDDLTRLMVPVANDAEPFRIAV
jgi:hypothetical protein